MARKSKPVEITAVFQREFQRWDNTVLAACLIDEDGSGQWMPLTVKCDAEIDELTPEQEYRFLGRWFEHPRYGRQFQADSFLLKVPHTRSGVITYLVDAGKGLGLGPVRAAKLWDWYGPDAVEAFRARPEEVAQRLADAGSRISPENAAAIAQKLRQHADMESCMLELMDVLTGRGFYRSTPRECVREWGNRAAQIIRRDPYKLMKFKGCGFKKCDKMYLELGHGPSRLKRQALCAWYTVERNTDGHTWFPESFVFKGLQSTISGAKLQPERAVQLAVRGRALATESTDAADGPVSKDGRFRWFAEARKAANEMDVAQLAAAAAAEPNSWPDLALVKRIDDHQAGQLAIACGGGPIGILGGGPGTGKTFTVAALVQHLAIEYGLEHIGIGAPTGKAAVRVSETLAAAGINLRARTWHSMLRGGSAGGFLYGINNPLPYLVLIGDESSMVDTDLMAAILRARAHNTLFLLVGDVNQLPPVGHGAPLRDLIAAGLPYGELTEIKRNSGGIVEACAAIRQGKPWQPADNLLLHEVDGADEQIEKMLDQLQRLRLAGLDPVWDCQVVVPVNKKSPLARKTLNDLLQRELNPSGNRVKDNPFRVGDKIVNTANGYFPAVEFDEFDPDLMTNDQGQVYVANGELAEVLHVETNLTIAKLNNPSRTVKIPRGNTKATDGDQDQGSEDSDGGDSDKTDTGCSWDLGFALSVHKSQGSEWPAVIVMLDEYPGARMICSREWIYTAISRAKQQCHLVGKMQTARDFCKRQAIWRRKTLLKERILQQQAKLELAFI